MLIFSVWGSLTKPGYSLFSDQKRILKKGGVDLFPIAGKRVHAELELLPECFIDVSG